MNPRVLDGVRWQRILLVTALTMSLIGCRAGSTGRQPAMSRVPAKLVSHQSNAAADQSRRQATEPRTEAQSSLGTIALVAHGLPEDTRRTGDEMARHSDSFTGETVAPESSVVAAQEVDFSVSTEQSPGSTVYTLDQLIGTALAYNPAIREAEAAVSKAMGLRYQVGLRPNPWVGYNGTQLADRSTGQHTAMVQQSYVSAQKLQRNTNVLNYEVENIRWQAEQQRRAVTSDVKQAFYGTLGAQQMLSLSEQFVEMAEKAVEVSRQRRIAGEGTEVDVLQSQVQLQQVAVSNRQATATLVGARTSLAAAVGQNDLSNIIVVGQLPEEPIAYNWDDQFVMICNQSPELMAAQTRVARARANLDRQLVQPTPNIDWMLGSGYDVGTEHSLINTQVGIPLPINNQNGGNQSAARAEYCRALHEVQRLQMSLKARLATAAQNYDSAAASVTLYRTNVIPAAEKMLGLAEKTFQAGEIDFLQVLTIRRTYYDSMYEYLSSRTRLAQSGALIEELLLSGSLDTSVDTGFDDGLRDQSLSGQ